MGNEYRSCTTGIGNAMLTYKEWKIARSGGIVVDSEYDYKSGIWQSYSEYKNKFKKEEKMNKKFENLQGNATVGQRIALHFASGLETRNWEISKQEASDAIGALKAVADSKSKTKSLIKDLESKYVKSKSKAKAKAKATESTAA